MKYVMVIPRGKRYWQLHWGPGVIHAHKGGMPLLREEPKTLRTFSGFWFNCSRGCYWFHFRRAPW